MSRWAVRFFVAGGIGTPQRRIRISTHKNDAPPRVVFSRPGRPNFLEEERKVKLTEYTLLYSSSYCPGFLKIHSSGVDAPRPQTRVKVSDYCNGILLRTPCRPRRGKIGRRWPPIPAPRLTAPRYTSSGRRSRRETTTLTEPLPRWPSRKVRCVFLRARGAMGWADWSSLVSPGVVARVARLAQTAARQNSTRFVRLPLSRCLVVAVDCSGDLVEKGTMRRLPDGFDGNTCPFIFTWSKERPNKVWGMGSGCSAYYNTVRRSRFSRLFTKTNTHTPECLGGNTVLAGRGTLPRRRLFSLFLIHAVLSYAYWDGAHTLAEQAGRGQHQDGALFRGGSL